MKWFFTENAKDLLEKLLTKQVLLYKISLKKGCQALKN